MERSEAISDGGVSAGGCVKARNRQRHSAERLKRGSIATQQWARGDGRLTRELSGIWFCRKIS